MPPGASSPQAASGSIAGPLERPDVLRIGAAAALLFVSGFLPGFSPLFGRQAMTSYGVHPALEDRLDARGRSDVLEARERAGGFEEWPSLYRLFRIMEMERELNRTTRRQLGIVRDKEDLRQADRFLGSGLAFFLSFFVYAGLVALWGGLRIAWRGHRALDATMVGAALLLGLVHSVWLSSLSFVRGGSYVRGSIAFGIVTAIALGLSAYRAARRPGYGRSFYAMAGFAAALSFFLAL